MNNTRNQTLKYSQNSNFNARGLFINKMSNPNNKTMLIKSGNHMMLQEDTERHLEHKTQYFK